MRFEVRQVIEVSDTDPKTINIISTEIIAQETGGDLAALAVDLLTDTHKLRAYKMSQYTGLTKQGGKRYVAVVTPLKNKRRVRVGLDLSCVEVNNTEWLKGSKLFPYMEEWGFEESEELAEFINGLKIKA